MATTILQTPLYQCHLNLKAKIITFAGYSLPVQYTSVIAESKSVRESSGLFDVSHMGRIRVQGTQALSFLEQLTAGDVSSLTEGLGQYSLILNEKGGCIDDIVIYQIKPEDYLVVVNAANYQEDLNWMKQHGQPGVTLQDETAETAMIALQGPAALSILQAICRESHVSAEQLPPFATFYGRIAGIDNCLIARSGYTGEDGFEIICPATSACTIWAALEDLSATPCGLGARDVLRVEAGLPLHGHELKPELNPIAAGLNWAISKKKTTFIGAEGIKKARKEGVSQKLRGIIMDLKRIPPIGTEILVDESFVGKITSGIYSPALEKGIGFAYINSEVELNTPCSLSIRGKKETGTITGKRFLKNMKKEN